MTESMPRQAVNILTQECDEDVASRTKSAGEIEVMRRDPDAYIGCHHGPPDPLGDLWTDEVASDRVTRQGDLRAVLFGSTDSDNNRVHTVIDRVTNLGPSHLLQQYTRCLPVRNRCWRRQDHDGKCDKKPHFESSSRTIGSMRRMMNATAAAANNGRSPAITNTG